MSKGSNIKGLQVLTVAVAAAVLIGAYTLSGNKSSDDLSNSVSTADTATKDTASRSEIIFLEDTENNSDIQKVSDTDINRNASDNDSESDRDKSKNSDSDSDTDSESNENNNSDNDSDSDEELEAEEGTVFPYRGVWNLIVVNKYNPIPESYDFALTEVEEGKKVDSRIVEDLQQMFDDMRAVGIYPVINEAYRTAEEQEAIMQDYISDYISQGYSEEEAEAEAKKWVAEPGTSEHQLGLAVDINADTNYSSSEAVYNWLALNAYRYGFILRYPQGKEDITGIDYEPWHYRYVGKAAAEQIYGSGECLEEYLSED